MTLTRPITNDSRQLTVTHTTRFNYNQPVEHSKHCVHLRPIDDAYQRVVSFRLETSPIVPIMEFQDVFGNWAGRFKITQPYTSLTLVADSTVLLAGVDPFDFARTPIRPSFPLIWMPWEHMMLSPYLVPLELPETQLREIYDYAMSFVEKNNHDLMETLFAMNLAIYRDFKFVPGCTGLETTPYEVFTSRKGVCQDFANLFICMSRLLGIPARYVCGYVYTGNTGTVTVQSDASHAWVQLYIPEAVGEVSILLMEFWQVRIIYASRMAGIIVMPPHIWNALLSRTRIHDHSGHR